MPNVKKLFVFILVLCVSASLRLSATAQIKPVYDQGALGLGRLLKRLNTSASAMMIGAHPDDEDTALLAYLARGENARTAYLSLTRGDGGQNIIGPELGEALGVIRTEELLQARKLDGAEQYFTRAYDYGFSKTLAEAKQKWDEKIILCDVVRVIRSFRPLIVISQFSGTPTDGHGQHQFAGYISPLAVKAAADSSQCAEAGVPWEVKKFYVRHRGQGEPTLRINTGKYDPLLGRSYFEIAMEARSQHKSQEQGVLELKGDQFSALNLVKDGATPEQEARIFDGLDISISQLRPKARAAAAQALKDFQPLDPQAILPVLLDGYVENLFHKADLLNIVIDRFDCVPTCAAPTPETTKFRYDAQSQLVVVDAKQNEFVKSILLAAGVRIDILSDRETVVPGEEFPVSIRFFHPPNQKVGLHDVRFNFATKIIPTPPTQTQSQSRREVPSLSAEYRLTVPREYPPSRPYWLYEKRNGDLFSTGQPYPDFRPFQDPAIKATFFIVVDGKHLLLELPVEYRYADDVRGEIRRNVDIVPLASVSLDQDSMIVARGAKQIRKNLAVTVTNNSSGPISGKIGLTLPDGWGATAGNSDVNLSKKGESTTVQFSVTVPANTAAGNFPLAASVTVGNTAYSRTMRTVAYPHIQTHRTYSDAVTKANVIDLKTSPAKIGYVEGSGDRVPQAIGQMGLAVETIDERTLASGDLSQFDVIVVGIRAYQVRADIAAHNKRLLDFANAGGTLIVQYQLPGYMQQGLAPFPAQQGPRVSDELAKVTILDSAHPLLNVPNKITDADFEGWVQERNLYNFSTMDAKYTGLLESHDLNEAENKGGLVTADVGKGKYIYCSYSLFRQLPAGVPGAYRLLANMLAYSGNGPRPARK